MGSQVVKVEFTPGENEQIELVVKVPEEPRSIIHGIVKDDCDKVIENAVVKLFEQDNPCNPCSLKPITHTFTDKCGQFLFGPLMPNKHYVIKVWVNDVKIRRMVIRQKGEDGVECDFEKEEDRVEDKRDIIITRSDGFPEQRETLEENYAAEEDQPKPPTRPTSPPAQRPRPTVRRPRQP